MGRKSQKSLCRPQVKWSQGGLEAGKEPSLPESPGTHCRSVGKSWAGQKAGDHWGTLCARCGESDGDG